MKRVKEKVSYTTQHPENKDQLLVSSFTDVCSQVVSSHSYIYRQKMVFHINSL